MAGARDDRLDRQLFRDLACGHSAALAALYDRHAASLFRHGLALTRRREEAEDLVHPPARGLRTSAASGRLDCHQIAPVRLPSAVVTPG